MCECYQGKCGIDGRSVGVDGESVEVAGGIVELTA